MTLLLETPRLLLRPQGPQDIEAIVAGLGDFEVTRFLTIVPFPYSRFHAEEWVARLRPPTLERAIFSIVLPATGEMIGTVTLADELGYWLARPHWGHGFMTEAAAALVRWYFANGGTGAIASGAHVGNERSLAVQLKLGFVEVRRRLRFVQALGGDVEHIETELTRDRFTASGSSE